MPRIRSWTLLGVALPALALAQAPQPAAAPQPPPSAAPAQAGGAPPAAPAATAAPSPTPEVAGLLAEVDALWRDRDGPGKMDEMKRKLDEAEKRAPRDYGVLWRMARWYYWTSDDLATPAEEKSR